MVGSGSQAVMLSANSGASLVTSSRPSRLLFLFFNNNNNNNRCPFRFKKSSILRPLRASSDEPDCNVEECAPDKEVGKVSVEWLAGEKTKVLGTFPPRNRGWTGYVEKDTAGQTNIYSVEPAVYVSESAISDGSENAKAIFTGLGLISIAAAALILLQVGKNSPPQIQTAEYSGPSLTYYINKFKPQEIIQARAQTETETETATETEISESNALQVSKVELES